MKTILAALILYIICFFTIIPAYADVIVLDDGRTLEGKIIKETEERITLKVKYGEIEILKHKISAIRRCPTAYEEYEEKAKEVEKTAQAHYDLAKWCEEKELGPKAKKHYLKALEIDPTFTPAGKALGYEKVEEKWLSPDDAKKAKGLVKFEGRWIKKEEKEKIVAGRDEKKQKELREKYEVGERFFVAQRTNLVLVTDLPEKKRKELINAAGALHDAIKKRFGKLFRKERDWPLVIFAFEKRDDFKERVKKDGLEDAVECHGYYSGKNKRSYIFECTSPDTVHMLLHEFTHQIYVERMLKGGARSQAWIFEGLAEYYEGHDLEEGGLCKAKPHRINCYRAKQLAKNDKLFPIEDMIKADQLTELFEEYDTEECFDAYAQAWAFVYYLLEGDKGKHRSKFMRFMKKDLQGEGTPEEFKKIFGSDLDKFKSSLAKYLKGL